MFGFIRVFWRYMVVFAAMIAILATISRPLAIIVAGGDPSKADVYILTSVGEWETPLTTVDGKKLWVTHGSESGELSEHPPDNTFTVLSCFPKRVAERFGYETGSDHDGVMLISILGNTVVVAPSK